MLFPKIADMGGIIFVTLSIALLSWQHRNLTGNFRPLRNPCSITDHKAHQVAVFLTIFYFHQRIHLTRFQSVCVDSDWITMIIYILNVGANHPSISFYCKWPKHVFCRTTVIAVYVHMLFMLCWYLHNGSFINDDDGHVKQVRCECFFHCERSPSKILSKHIR